MFQVFACGSRRCQRIHAAHGDTGCNNSIGFHECHCQALQPDGTRRVYGLGEAGSQRNVPVLLYNVFCGQCITRTDARPARSLDVPIPRLDFLRGQKPEQSRAR